MNESFDFFQAGELPAPTLSVAEATDLVAQHFGLVGELVSLGSQQDQNFLVRIDGAPHAVLKIANPAFPVTEIEAQDAAAATVAAACPELRVATLLEHNGRPCSVMADTSEGPRSVRLLRFLPGGTLADRGYLSPKVVARMGELAARVSVALADFDAPSRVLQWDLVHASRVVEQLASAHPDPERRAQIIAATAAAAATLAQLDDDLPRQAGHFDLTDDNVVAEHEGTNLADGLIDFGDVMTSWAIGELAVTISSVLHHLGAEPASVLPAVRAFHALRPLSESEADALWPLVVLRGAVLVVSGEQQVQIDADNDYAAAAIEREWRIFEVASSIPTEVMAALIRHAVGLPAPDGPTVPETEIGRDQVTWLDLSSTSDVADEGAWLMPGLDEQAAVALHQAGAQIVAAPYAVPRISGAIVGAQKSPATVPTGLTIWLAHGRSLRAPFAGSIAATAAEIVLEGAMCRLTIRGSVAEASTSAVQAGDPIGTAQGRIDLQITAARAPRVPTFVRPEEVAGWLALTADPIGLLGAVADLDPGRAPVPAESSEGLLERRDAALAPVQEHYFDEPPQIERGWQHHLVSTDGRAYLDFVNNVTSIGHAHPRLTAAVADQMGRLNTNSRFHYAAATDFAEALVAELPEPLDTVFLVNSGSEAVDLAMRIAMAATGRSDIVAVQEAYHGWTFASDAVSTSIADNPNALSTRPQWVHTVDAPNSFRGKYRGLDAAQYAPEAVVRIDALVEAGARLAGFIAEAFYGNAGGVALPDGYLREVYAAIRAHGGLAIADEVQVGYGRLGHWFWGFEQQGVVPDVVAVAKSIGNGYPLGAVITSRAVAERYRTQGYFFSSTGGSPVSGVVGQTVLSIIREEGLQQNAAAVGGLLKSRLEDLSERHEIIGAVHGSGLYLGAEFIRDPKTLEPATAETAAICDRLLELGVIMQPTGDHQNVLKIKPPLCVDEAAVEQFIAALDRVLTEGW